jgi:rhamnosyl/mannosyltransferase
VHFLGPRGEADKFALIDAATALVLPSHLRTEAFGVVLLEASMRGKPMITAEIGTGTSFVNRHEETGLVVPPADPAALAAAMQRLWDNPELARRMGEAARRRFDAEFTAARMAERYAALYRRVLDG